MGGSVVYSGHDLVTALSLYVYDSQAFVLFILKLFHPRLHFPAFFFSGTFSTLSLSDSEIYQRLGIAAALLRTAQTKYLLIVCSERRVVSFSIHP